MIMDMNGILIEPSRIERINLHFAFSKNTNKSSEIENP